MQQQYPIQQPEMSHFAAPMSLIRITIQVSRNRTSEFRSLVLAAQRNQRPEQRRDLVQTQRVYSIQELLGLRPSDTSVDKVQTISVAAAGNVPVAHAVQQDDSEQSQQPTMSSPKSSRMDTQSALPDWPTFSQRLITALIATLTEDDDQECAVCMQAYDDEDTVPIRFAACKHYMCRECALQWFKPASINDFEPQQTNTCPQCRTRVFCQRRKGMDIMMSIVAPEIGIEEIRDVVGLQISRFNNGFPVLEKLLRYG
ncbi:hypothetical protein BAUCODRAFT_488133 [Baudoinia panamericana UAMH 10762]|uniref:RING-type domain-containing protein n=1 Tax=Baudoinia panamericana (strain UAMH 10762) TaxID=717646 RepID=M2MYQ1_BAUPA|nr:uncharacterized protein BAUCODRAFT_488133 [Baudoinia panamericana UAMH 10762]EMC96738.1 hypothetical protein BAUCODRAFT_488133 [Baudoinia panamericana UAMH 10762]